MSPRSSFATRGFTLVEISIVLVIIGLIAGGIMAGSNLIHAAGLKKVIEEEQNIVQATLLFKQKYTFLPGDFPEATTIWGMAPSASSPAASDAACAALDATSPSQGTNTCNGNGDGKIGNGSDTAAMHEHFRYWQHLSNAGLIDGKYTGVARAGSPIEATIGVNVPVSKFNGLGWFGGRVNYDEASDALGALFLMDYNHTLVVGTEYPLAPPAAPGFSPQDAYFIDAKMDDGFPGKGSVITPTFLTDCHTATTVTDYNATYKTDSSEITCTLLFPNLPF